MFTKPGVALIEQLHQYGRELAVLKRIYKSYALIIERILDRQQPVKRTASIDASDEQVQHQPPNRNRAVQHLGAPSAQNEGGHIGAQTFGAPLSSSAIVRFERLLDRVNLFVISEIQECLDEKESLVFLVRFAWKSEDQLLIMSRTSTSWPVKNPMPSSDLPA